MKKIITLILLLLLTACSRPFFINDRLSYTSSQNLKNEFGKHNKIDIEIDKDTKDLFISQKPSGFTGGAITLSFPMGRTFSAYLQQMSEIAFTGTCDECFKITVKIIDCKIDYTNSLYAGLASSEHFLDYFKMDTIIEVQYFKNTGKLFNKNYHYISQKELGINEVKMLNRDAAVIYVIEDISKKLIKDIIKEIKNL